MKRERPAPHGCQPMPHAIGWHNGIFATPPTPQQRPANEPERRECPMREHPRPTAARAYAGHGRDRSRSPLPRESPTRRVPRASARTASRWWRSRSRRRPPRRGADLSAFTPGHDLVGRRNVPGLAVGRVHLLEVAIHKHRLGNTVAANRADRILETIGDRKPSNIDGLVHRLHRRLDGPPTFHAKRPHLVHAIILLSDREKPKDARPHGTKLSATLPGIHPRSKSPQLM